MPEYVEYETLASQLRINRTDNLVCIDCGVLVVDKNVHDRLHSIMSSWAWKLAVIQTSHASAEIHDKYDVIQRVDNRTFAPARKDDKKPCEQEYESPLARVRQADLERYHHSRHKCILAESGVGWEEQAHMCRCDFAWAYNEATGEMRRLIWDEKHKTLISDTEESAPKTDKPDRYEIAWKLWSWIEEVDTPTQRSSGNWLKLGDEQLTKRERTDRDLYLSRSDEIVAMAGKRQYARFLDNGTFRCLETGCEREPEFTEIDQVFIHARCKHDINSALIESPQNEESKK